MIWNFPYNSPLAIIELLKEENLAMNKKFGQNFLISPPAWEKIVESLGEVEGQRVWEIGPGLGVLTHLLLKTGALVTAFEIDHGFSRILREQAFAGEENFTLVEGDFLKTWPKVFSQAGPPAIICGNLPYNVGSICIARLLEEQCLPERMSFTLQKEVGERLLAQEGSKLWSPLSILAQIDYALDLVVTLNSGVFFPPPKVDSVVIKFSRRTTPLVKRGERTEFLRVVNDLFTQRRKTVRNNLLNGKTGAIYGKEGVLEALTVAGIAESERAEKLSIENLIRLTESLTPSKR
ncbi:MAG: 16S rRNA (adenine(1518)-N(6)/adenine(1519)-N(6))-dimethyltransferase RsmA [Sphaerochaetaceae bacterium]|jgi:16S rRNA (adenine1518-N6/adenine1519-N6)-dimethyltransferase